MQEGNSSDLLKGNFVKEVTDLPIKVEIQEHSSLLTQTTLNFGGGEIFLKYFTPKLFSVFFENGEKMKKDEVQ